MYDFSGVRSKGSIASSAKIAFNEISQNKVEDYYDPQTQELFLNKPKKREFFAMGGVKAFHTPPAGHNGLTNRQFLEQQQQLASLQQNNNQTLPTVMKRADPSHYSQFSQNALDSLVSKVKIPSSPQNQDNQNTPNNFKQRMYSKSSLPDVDSLQNFSRQTTLNHSINSKDLSSGYASTKITAKDSPIYTNSSDSTPSNRNNANKSLFHNVKKSQIGSIPISLPYLDDDKMDISHFQSASTKRSSINRSKGLSGRSSYEPRPILKYRSVLDSEPNSESDLESSPSSDPTPKNDTESNGSISLVPSKKNSSHQQNTTQTSVYLEERNSYVSMMVPEAVNKRRLSNYSSSNSKSHNLSALCWLAVLPEIYTNEAKKKYKLRRTIALGDFHNNYIGITKAVKTFFLDAVGEQLEDLFNEKQSMCLTQKEESGIFGKKELSTETLEERVTQLIKPKIRVFFDKLIAATTSSNMPDFLLRFLASISENKCVPPTQFYTEFELKRLRFNSYGCLKGLTGDHSRMILCIFMLSKVLIYMLILHPWEEIKYGPKPDRKNKIVMRNIKTFASILSNSIEDFVRSSVPVSHIRQRNVPSKWCIEAVKRGHLVFDDGKQRDLGSPTEENRFDGVIEGLYSKSKLGYFFKQRKQDTLHIRSLIQAWVDKVYGLSHNYYLSRQREVLGRVNYK